MDKEDIALILGMVSVLTGFWQIIQNHHRDKE